MLDETLVGLAPAGLCQAGSYRPAGKNEMGMLQISLDENQRIRLAGSFDAAEVKQATRFFERVAETRIVDFSDLEYIASAGLGVLLAVQQRLQKTGHELRLTNLNHHARDIFRYSGLDQIFEIV